jgi:hypothetical protein
MIGRAPLAFPAWAKATEVAVSLKHYGVLRGRVIAAQREECRMDNRAASRVRRMVSATASA